MSSVESCRSRRVDEAVVADIDADMREGPLHVLKKTGRRGEERRARPRRDRCRRLSSTRRGSEEAKARSKTWRVKPLQSKPCLRSLRRRAVANADQVHVAAREAGCAVVQLPQQARRGRARGVVRGRVVTGDGCASRPFSASSCSTGSVLVGACQGRRCGEAENQRCGEARGHGSARREVRIGAQQGERREGRQPPKRCLTSAGAAPNASQAQLCVTFGRCAIVVAQRLQRRTKPGEARCSRLCCSRRMMLAFAPRFAASTRPAARGRRHGVASSTRRSTTRTALAITGKAPVVRSWPMVPGIDLAGTVTACRPPTGKAGDKVVLNGWGVGETHWGGLGAEGAAQAATGWSRSPRVRHAPGDGDRHRRLHRDAVRDRARAPRREARRRPGAGDRRGRRRRQRRGRAAGEARATRSTPSTGRPQEADYLRGLGAAEIVDRAELTVAGRSKPWARPQAATMPP